PVLAMHRNDVLPKRIESMDRISRAIQNHIGRIEIDPKVIAIDVEEKVEQRIGSFLSGLQRECLAVPGGMIADAPDDLAHGNVVGITGILGDKADMSGYSGDTELGCEVAHLERSFLTFSAGSVGYEPDGIFHGGGMGIALTRIRAEDRQESDVRVLQCLLPLGRSSVKLHFARNAICPQRTPTDLTSARVAAGSFPPQNITPISRFLKSCIE